MYCPCFNKWIWKSILLAGMLVGSILVQGAFADQMQPVTIEVLKRSGGPDLSPQFLGLSYEMSMVLPKEGQYYFDSHDSALVNIFKTLGVRNLRVGANAVDDPRIPVPQEKNIDALFDFARAAGVQVIYSFRLKNGDPTNSARLAKYIATHYADMLDCFSIGNEANFYLKPFDTFFAQWKPQYDAILKAVPDAMFDGPSGSPDYGLALANAMYADGHLAMVSEHFYFLGFGRPAEENPPATRARFLSNKLHAKYRTDYSKLGAVLAARGVPYRIDEMNNCCDGGAKGSSDTYTSTLWALDCTHWWAAHHILGINYHTGELVGRDGKFGPPNYAAFLRRKDGHGFTMRPQGYAYLAFSQGAHGQPLDVHVKTVDKFNFDAYAYQDRDGSIYLTLINKSYDSTAQTADVSFQLPENVRLGLGKRLDLLQQNDDIAAKTGITLGGAEVNPQGIWTGQWETLKEGDFDKMEIRVPPASASIIRLYSPG